MQLINPNISVSYLGKGKSQTSGCTTEHLKTINITKCGRWSSQVLVSLFLCLWYCLACGERAVINWLVVWQMLDGSRHISWVNIAINQFNFPHSRTAVLAFLKNHIIN